MSHYSTLFSSLLLQIPRHHFEILVKQHGADRYAKKLSTWNQFTALLYAQISGLESLREIESAFSVQNLRTYHLGLPSKICRNTLSHANAKRDWRIYEGMFYKLLARCRDLTPKHKFNFPNPLYSIDATTISLCLSVFPWSISGVTKNFDPSAVVRATGDCAEVTFPKSRKSYLYYLTDYRQAPTIRSGKPFELGLGPFYVDEMGPDLIRLVRKKSVRRGYNFITLRHYLGQSDPQLENRWISDFNKISSVEIPEWVKTEQIGFDDVVINTVTLVINHPDRKVREAVYNCLDVRGLREAFIRQRKDFLDIGSVIPIGVFGARPGLPDQACRAVTKLNNQLIFANLRTGNEAELEKFFDGFTRRTGLRVKVVNFAVPELLKMLKRTPKGYNLFIMSKDAVRSEVEPFLRYFYLLDYKLPEISIKYDKLTHEDDPVEKKRLGAEIADNLAREFIVLPLYQNVREYHYPRGIKNLIVGRGFFEFPEVADFRW